MWIEKRLNLAFNVCTHCAAYSPWRCHPERGANCTNIPRFHHHDRITVGAIFLTKQSEGPARLLLRAGDIASAPGQLPTCLLPFLYCFMFSSFLIFPMRIALAGGEPLEPDCGSGGAGCTVGESVCGPEGTQLTWWACSLTIEGKEQQQRLDP